MCLEKVTQRPLFCLIFLHHCPPPLFFLAKFATSRCHKQTFDTDRKLELDTDNPELWRLMTKLQRRRWYQSFSKEQYSAYFTYDIIVTSIMMWIWMITGWELLLFSDDPEHSYSIWGCWQRGKGPQPLLFTTSPSKCAWGDSSHLLSSHLKLSLQLGTKGWEPTGQTWTFTPEPVRK